MYLNYQTYCKSFIVKYMACFLHIKSLNTELLRKKIADKNQLSTFLHISSNLKMFYSKIFITLTVFADFNS